MAKLEEDIYDSIIKPLRKFQGIINYVVLLIIIVCISSIFMFIYIWHLFWLFAIVAAIILGTIFIFTLEKFEEFHLQCLVKTINKKYINNNYNLRDILIALYKLKFSHKYLKGQIRHVIRKLEAFHNT
jgi:low affinity Fe/Cu permease